MVRIWLFHEMKCPFVAQTVLMGGNPRVGLEDNLYLSKGKVSN